MNWLEKERAERRQLFGGKFEEPAEVMPVPINAAPRGAICRHWYMPNQSRFVFAGVSGGIAKIVLPSGAVSGLTMDALVVVVSPPPLGFAPLIDRIEAFEREIFAAAWRGRE